MSGAHLLLASVAAFVALVALAALSAPARAQQACTRARIGQSVGMPHHLHTTFLAPGLPDWNVALPAPECADATGEEALVCDHDVPPVVDMLPSGAVVVRRAGWLQGYALVNVTVYCGYLAYPPPLPLLPQLPILQSPSYLVPPEQPLFLNRFADLSPPLIATPPPLILETQSPRLTTPAKLSPTDDTDTELLDASSSEVTPTTDSLPIDTDDTEDAQDAGDAEDTEDEQYADDTQDAENADDTEDAQDVGDTEDTVDTENAEDVSSVSSEDDTEDIQDTMNADDRELMLANSASLPSPVVNDVVTFSPFLVARIKAPTSPSADASDESPTVPYLWQDPREATADAGHARWDPSISYNLVKLVIV